VVLAATGEQSWTAAVVFISGAVLACVGLGALKGALGTLKVATGAWKTADGAAGQNGLQPIGAASVKSFTMSMKNLFKYAKLKLRPSIPARLSGAANASRQDGLYATGFFTKTQTSR